MLQQMLGASGGAANGILLDLGVSSMQVCLRQSTREMESIANGES